MADSYGLGDYQNLLGSLDYSKKNNRIAAQYIMRDGIGLNTGKIDGVFGKNTNNAFQQAYDPSVVEKTTKSSTPDWAHQQINNSYNGYGNESKQSPEADSYYSMQNELNGASPKTNVDGSSPVVSYGLFGKGGYMQGVGDSYRSAKESIFGAEQPKQTYQDYVNANGSAPNMMTQSEWNTQQLQAQNAADHSFATNMGFGMGAINTGLGVMSYFDNKAMNKKNMQLMDQQIANNQDIMATRRERAADIKKYFG